jgi:hypothetical protein
MNPNKRGTLLLPTHHLVTHGVVVGATGSGKTGGILVMVEEALRAGVPTLMIDVKGDLPNLLLAFPELSAEAFKPWVDAAGSVEDGRSATERATQLAAEHRAGLETWGIAEQHVADYVARRSVRVITPGSSAGELLHVLSSLERRSERWSTDPESARAALSAAVSLLLRLLGRDCDPAKSRDHVLLAVLAERRLKQGESADLGALLNDLAALPIESIGALPVDDFMPKNERKTLAAALNTLLASPSFETWRQGSTLDIEQWLRPDAQGRTPAVIVSVAHLDDEERALVLGVLLEEVLSWVRAQPGSQRLRALIVFDEVYGFMPPHPANPPTKRPLVALMKQARAFGVGVVVATQNPMDLDYRTLGNAGFWMIGRLQTDADRARVVEGLAGTAGADDMSAADLARVIKRLASRWFLVRNVHSKDGMLLVQPRWAMSFMRGPMTRAEIQRALGKAEHGAGAGGECEGATAEARAGQGAGTEVRQES